MTTLVKAVSDKKDVKEVKTRRRRISLYETAMSPELTEVTTPVVLTGEQEHYIREILDICCSDSQFARKAYDSIQYVLHGSPIEPAILTALTPSTAALGSSSFTLSVTGTGFLPTDSINWNGSDEVTTFVSDTELTTLVDMTTAIVPASIPVTVGNSDPLMFELTSAARSVQTSSPKTPHTPSHEPSDTEVKAMKNDTK